MKPQTLREVAGLGTTPSRLQDSALIMVDLQNTYREGVMRLAEVEEAIVRPAGCSIKLTNSAVR